MTPSRWHIRLSSRSHSCSLKPTNQPTSQPTYPLHHRPTVVRALGALINLSGPDQPHLKTPLLLPIGPGALFKLSLGLLVPVKQCCRSAGLQLSLAKLFSCRAMGMVAVLGRPQPCPITIALPVDHRAVPDPGCPDWALAKY